MDIYNSRNFTNFLNSRNLSDIAKISFAFMSKIEDSLRESAVRFINEFIYIYLYPNVVVQR